MHMYIHVYIYIYVIICVCVCIYIYIYHHHHHHHDESKNQATKVNSMKKQSTDLQQFPKQIITIFGLDFTYLGGTVEV